LAEIRQQIQRLRDDIANWRTLIESKKSPPAREDQQQAGPDAPSEGRKPPQS
jgi:hypothetical protein